MHFRGAYEHSGIKAVSIQADSLYCDQACDRIVATCDAGRAEGVARLGVRRKPPFKEFSMAGSDFFSRLYAGFEAEHFVTGKLFGAGLEAFKLPADFGFDLLVSNQREALAGRDPAVVRDNDFPYAVQVKSRAVTETHYGAGPNGRPEVSINFRVNKSEYDKLNGERRSYLVCVASLKGREKSIGDQVLYFWLKGTQLSQLRQHSYLEETSELGRIFFDLSVCFRFRPTQRRQDLLDRLVKEEKLTAAGAKDLSDTLPEEIWSSWGSEYVALNRKPWRKAEGGYVGSRTVAKQLKHVHLDLAQIGCSHGFPTLDECESFPTTAPYPL